MILILAAFGAGCASPYWSDRAHDLSDVAHVDINFPSLGVSANAGPAILGAHVLASPCSGGIRTKYGLAGSEEAKPCGLTMGLVVPMCHENNGDARSRLGYGSRAPAWGSVGIDVGFMYGFSARVDLVEFLDSLLGWTTLDILRDDK